MGPVTQADAKRHGMNHRRVICYGQAVVLVQAVVLYGCVCVECETAAVLGVIEGSSEKGHIRLPGM